MRSAWVSKQLRCFKQFGYPIKKILNQGRFWELGIFLVKKVSKAQGLQILDVPLLDFGRPTLSLMVSLFGWRCHKTVCGHERDGVQRIDACDEPQKLGHQVSISFLPVAICSST